MAFSAPYPLHLQGWPHYEAFKGLTVTDPWGFQNSEVQFKSVICRKGRRREDIDNILKYGDERVNPKDSKILEGLVSEQDMPTG